MPSRLTVVLVSLLLATPVIIFWLWLVILPTSVEIQCPEECRCEGDGYYVNCSVSGLDSIPSILPKHMRKFVVDGNNITLFAKDYFFSKGLDELRIIKADFCNIKKIDVGAFNGLPKLEHLSVQSNEISEITPGTFEKLCRLEYLHLARNRIEHLGANIFYGLVNLKYIFLQENELQYVHPDTFLGLPSFQRLYLSENSGLQIPTDLHFINSLSLKQLAISDCNISSVSVETFANVSELEWLDLSYNYLRSLDINILKVLRKLSHLNLENNEIIEIIPGVFGNNSLLEYLDLDNNKIEHLGIDVFYGLINLKYVCLEGNILQYLRPETFLELPNLKSLFLSSNFGLQIPTDRHFINSHSLKHLAISGCNISSVKLETFSSVSALELLDLGENNLESLDISILKALPQLSEMYLDGNPLQCDCQLQEVWRWCRDHNIETEYGECASPIEVEGIWWGVLEKGQCSQGNIQYCGDYNSTRYSYTQIEDTDPKTDLNTQPVMWKTLYIFLNSYKLPITAVLFIFGTTGNVIIIIIILCNKDMRTVPNMYILNVAISDVIYLTILFASAWPHSAQWLNYGVMCIAYSFCFPMSVNVTAYSIALLSIQRYRVTINQFHVHDPTKPKWRGIVASVFGVWIVAALFTVPSAVSSYHCVRDVK
jgi:Leucine-rich repeat (LRR) protein